MEDLFQEASFTHKCPRCTTGYVVGPLWDYTKQGKVYTVNCVNCGWRENSELYFVDFTMPAEELPAHEARMRRATRNVEVIRVPKRLPLSQYDFGGEETNGS